MTLPAHASMLTGLYPAEHGIHENARYLDADHVLLAERLRDGRLPHRRLRLRAAPGSAVRAGPRLRALRRRDGPRGRRARRRRHHRPRPRLARPRPATGRSSSGCTTSIRTIPTSRRSRFGARYPDDPYLGEIAYMDRELGRLLAGFDGRCGAGDCNVLVAGDHGEARGDHGEAAARPAALPGRHAGAADRRRRRGDAGRDRSAGQHPRGVRHRPRLGRRGRRRRPARRRARSRFWARR